MHTLYADALSIFRVILRPLPEHPPVPANVVYTISLKYKQDLERLPDTMPNCKRNSTHFSSCNIKMVNPTGTVLLFESGKLVCVGAMTPWIGFYALMWQRLKLIAAGAHCAFEDPSINNIVMINSLGHSIDMAAFVAHNEESCHYVPKKFSGCTFSNRMGSDNDLCLDMDELAKQFAKLDDDLSGLGEKFDDLSMVAPENFIRDETKEAHEAGVIFEAGKFNVMGVTSYEAGFQLSEEIIRRTQAFRCEPRRKSPGVVERRKQELVQARIAYAEKVTQNAV